MNIIIVGAGVVGESLAEHLATSDNHVCVVDNNAALCEALESKLDVFVVNGPGSAPATLERAGIRIADMVVAVTPSDETNLVICNFAKQFGVERRIARLKSGDYTQSESGINLQELGVTHFVEPEREVVEAILEYIELPGATQIGTFQGGNVYLRGYRVSDDMPIAHRTLLEINAQATPAPMLFVLIIRDGKAIFPTGTERLLPRDEVIAIMPRDSFEVFRSLINRSSGGKLGKVVVSGDTLMAMRLAEALKAHAQRVILVDPDRAHGRTAAEALDGIDVIYGDCTRTEMLQEVHIENASFFIAGGKDGEDNLMSCLLAKAEGAREVIAVTSEDRHSRMFHSLGLDHIINPRRITAHKIIESIQVIPIGMHLPLKNIDVEVMRFVTDRHSRITGKPLSKLDKVLHGSIIIGSILRDGYVIIPNGNTVIEPADEVLVLCSRRETENVKRLFSGGLPVIV